MTRSDGLFLAVRVGRAGDMVMITPALKSLLSARPGAEIHLLTGAEGKRILAGFDSRVTTFLVYSHGPFRRLMDRPALLKTIRANNYDSILVFESNPRFLKLFRGTASPVFRMESRPPDQHYSECCMDLVERVLREPVTRYRVALPVSEAGKRKADAYFRLNGINAGDFVVGFHATFSSAAAPLFRKREARIHRSWPQASFVSLARFLCGYGRSNGIPLRIVMDVLPEDRALVEGIAQGSGGIVQILSGPPDFDRYKAVLARMNLLVTPDTGPMHIAAAVGTPLVALFSLKSPADCGPFCDESMATILRAEDSPQPALGLAAITPEAVFESCLKVLAAWRLGVDAGR